MKNKKSETSEKVETFKENKALFTRDNILCTAAVICAGAGMITMPYGAMNGNDTIAALGAILTFAATPVLMTAAGYSTGPTGI